MSRLTNEVLGVFHVRIVAIAAVFLGLSLAQPALGQLTADDIAALRARGQREGWTFSVGENAATQRPASVRHGLIKPADWRKRGRWDNHPALRDLPPRFDWREQNGCTPIRDQGYCGACWAFATVGPLECNIKIKTGEEVDLSEQWLVSCNQDDFGCWGGLWAHDYHLTATDPCNGSGAVLESAFPYVANDVPCSCPYIHKYWIADWAYIGDEYNIPPIDSIKQAIQDHGPVSVAIYANDAFDAYVGGVFNACEDRETNHAVVLVGWDDSLGSMGAWIMRNSWGTWWGDAGYMYIQYGCCRIGEAACYINYVPPPTTVSISGTVHTGSGAAIAGVTMGGLPGNVTTDTDGHYYADVTGGWSGTVRPAKPGYSFSPPSRVYNNIVANQTEQDFTGTLRLHIAGRVAKADGSALSNVSMNGLPGAPLTAEDGTYSANVNAGWTGTVMPSRNGYDFDPPARTYQNVQTDQVDQNYGSTLRHFVIAGAAKSPTGAAVPGVLMSGLPGDPVTDANGGYSVVVEFGWSGTVTPSKTGYDFDPPKMIYASIVTAPEVQSYKATLRTFAISGSVATTDGAALAGVVMNGLPANPTTSSFGFYAAKVDFNWSGTVTPTKAGYTFDPPSRTYSSVVAEQTGVKYTAAAQTFKVSGRIAAANGAGVADVVLSGLPGNPATAADGSYTASVKYGWSGTVTPVKTGYTFNPPSYTYASVAADQLAKNFACAEPVENTGGDGSTDGSGDGSGSGNGSGDGSNSGTDNGSGNGTDTSGTGDGSQNGANNPGLSGAAPAGLCPASTLALLAVSVVGLLRTRGGRGRS